MNNEEAIKDLIEGFGAVAELGYIMYNAYINAGFTHSDALKLTTSAQEVILSEALKNRGSSE